MLHPADAGPRSTPPELQRLRRRDLNLLMVLRVLLETASVSETARRLGSTQPSISRMLERLRDELGDPLLVKTSNTMVLTARGEALRPLLDDMAGLLDTVYRPADTYRFAEAARTCVIGANDSLQALFAAPLVMRMRSSAPRALLRFKPVPFPHPMRALLEREVDLLLVMSKVDEASGYRAEVLFESAFSCMCATGNPHVGATVAPAQLATLPYLDVSHMGVISAITDGIFVSVGLRKRTVATMSSFLAAPEVVAGSDLVSLVPSYMAPTLARHPGIRIVPLVADAATPHAIRMVWHNGTHFDAFLDDVRALIRGLARPMAGRI